ETTPPKSGTAPCGHEKDFFHPSFANHAKLASTSETFRIGTIFSALMARTLRPVAAGPPGTMARHGRADSLNTTRAPRGPRGRVRGVAAGAGGEPPAARPRRGADERSAHPGPHDTGGRAPRRAPRPVPLHARARVASPVPDRLRARHGRLVHHPPRVARRNPP